MAKNLVIVESPAKAKTIEKFLGTDFIVKSSFGHIRDLESSDKAIDVENGFEPTYVVSKDKKKIVAELKKIAKTAEKVWLATDEDREGEAISWHLFEVLGLKESTTERIVFHEITKTAILAAVQNPRKIDINLVKAQQARRVLDRLVGFELSPVLWRKVKPKLSAGRVQSVAVKLIVEREREIVDFKPASSFKISANFNVDNASNKLLGILNKKPKSQDDAQQILADCANATFTVEDITVKPAIRKPAAPFTTSTLQQEASRKLGYSVAQTMRIAQNLYESGLITYMRTDSVNLSDLAINESKQQITEQFGPEYSKTRQYKTKSSGAQEAHEAIRPTSFSTLNGGKDNQDKKLYQLIWKRTVASQMADAELERTKISIGISNRDEVFAANGEVIKIDGFLKLYIEGTDDEDDEDNKNLLPAVLKGQDLMLNDINATERFTRASARYTEASLVKKLEENGIGRPSTYAPTISTIQRRGYVVKENRDGIVRNYVYMSLENGEVIVQSLKENTGFEKNKMFPTDIGMLVTDFLSEHFKNVMDYGFTAKVEEEFDKIAMGMKEWNGMIQEFYNPFHKKVEDTIETSERVTGERELGNDPKTGKPIIVRMGKFGPLAQIGHRDDEEPPKFASLRTGQSIETIGLEDALELFKLPRELGEFEGEKISVAIGRFGPYVRVGKVFASIDKELDPLKIDLKTAIEIMVAKKEAIKNALIKDFKDAPDITIKNGRYGPYINQGRKNYKIPKDVEPASLTLEQVMEIINTAPAKKGAKGTKKAAKPKAKAKVTATKPKPKK